MVPQPQMLPMCWRLQIRRNERRHRMDMLVVSPGSTAAALKAHEKGL